MLDPRNTGAFQGHVGVSGQFFENAHMAKHQCSLYWEVWRTMYKSGHNLKAIPVYWPIRVCLWPFLKRVHLPILTLNPPLGVLDARVSSVDLGLRAWGAHGQAIMFT